MSGKEEDKEKRIQETMQATGLPRADAEIIYEQEQGNIDGDVIIEGENDTNS